MVVTKQGDEADGGEALPFLTDCGGYSVAGVIIDARREG
jgi:hypothetical protein